MHKVLPTCVFLSSKEMYLCSGSKKLNKVNIAPTCCRLWSPSLQVSRGFLWPCLLSQMHITIFKSCHREQRAYWCQLGVFLINRPSELRAVDFMNRNSSVWTWVIVEIPLSVRCWTLVKGLMWMCIMPALD